MNRGGIAVLVALVVVGVAPVAAASTFGASGLPPSLADDASGNESVPPGARLAGVVGTQGAELEGEVAVRTFNASLAEAADASGKAAVVAGTVEEVSTRLEALRERKGELDAAYENGSMNRGAYRAQVARLAARIDALERLANATSRTAADLPEEALAERGVDVAAVQRLQREASNISGSEVAEIARSIAGNGGSVRDRASGRSGELPGDGERGNAANRSATPTADANGTGGDRGAGANEARTAAAGGAGRGNASGGSGTSHGAGAASPEKGTATGTPNGSAGPDERDGAGPTNPGPTNRSNGNGTTVDDVADDGSDAGSSGGAGRDRNAGDANRRAPDGTTTTAGGG